MPFHMWTPDAYQGAPTPVTAFMSAATKVAAFARASSGCSDVAFRPLTWDWRPFDLGAGGRVAWSSGSVLAIAQTDVKRMLAYSSIAHAGFILTGLTAANQDGHPGGDVLPGRVRGDDRSARSASSCWSRSGARSARASSAYAGLARRSPSWPALMTLFLLSLAGIPPTAGFIAKVGVFGAAIQAGDWPLVLIGVLASVVAAFFYLRVIVLMYMQEPAGVAAATARTGATRRWLASAGLLVAGGPDAGPRRVPAAGPRAPRKAVGADVVSVPSPASGASGRSAPACCR